MVSREAVAAEGVAGGYAAVYPVLRAMEESGRARRGYFVAGLGAAQFAIPGAVERLRAAREEDEDATRILAATDPAQPYGAALPWPRWSDEDRRPLARAAGAYVVIVDGQPTVYLDRGGRSLQTLPAFADREMAAASLTALRGLLADGRFRLLSLEKVDGQPLADSPHADVLEAAGFQRSYRGWLLRA